MLFRDESAKTIRKLNATKPLGKKASMAKLAQRKKTIIPFNSSSSPCATPSSRPSTAIVLQILRNPGVNVDELATHFFIGNYAYYDTWYSADYEGWILTTIGQDGNLNHGLQAAIQAVGMAGLANCSPSPEMATRAGILYNKALQSVNSALKDPILAIRDETLLMVIVLGLFEVSCKF